MNGSNLLIVVQNNYHICVQISCVVHRLVGHSTCDCAVANNGNNVIRSTLHMSAARQDKKIAGPGGSEGPRIPPQRSLSLWAISQTPRARKDAHTSRWAWTEKRAVLGVSRRGDQCILFALPVRARQVAEPDLEGRSTGRSDTSFAAADARYGRGRPGDARGACLGGATDASRLFSRRKTMVG